MKIKTKIVKFWNFEITQKFLNNLKFYNIELQHAAFQKLKRKIEIRKLKNSLQNFIFFIFILYFKFFNSKIQRLQIKKIVQKLQNLSSEN